MLTALAISSALGLAGIHFAPALASIGLGASVFFALLFFIGNPSLFFKVPKFLYLPAILLLWQFIGSSFLPPIPGTTQKLLLRLPLALIPVLMAMQHWKTKVTLLWLCSITIIPAWISLASVVNYLRHFAFLNQMILESKPLPIYTSVYHIEFSFLMALTALTSLIWLYFNRNLIKTFAGSLLFASLIVLIACLHILSVRTGILCFWTGLGFFSLSQLRLGKIKFSYLALGVALLLGIAMALPSVRNRIINTAEDFSTVVNRGDLNNKSFGQRWEAWRASVWVIKHNPLTGVGMKGVEEALEPAYVAIQSPLDASKRVLPHNEYLDLSVQSGLPAGLILLAFIFWGVIWAWQKRLALLFAILPSVAVAMAFESLLERQAGVLIIVILLPFAAGLNQDSKNAQIN